MVNSAAVRKDSPIIPLDTITLPDWIKTVISQPSIQSPEHIKLNGYESRPEVKEAIESLLIVHKRSGYEAALEAWREQVSKVIPDIAELVTRPRRLYHADELDQLPPVRWLIENEIPERGYTVLYGPPSAGKSFLALDYAERISHNRPVIYIVGEGISGFQRRHKAWKLHHKPTKTHKLHFWAGAVNMLNANDILAFVSEIEHLKPQLIIIDTLARCMVGGDENSSQDMGRFNFGCDMLRETLNTAVLVIHHTSKAGGERGSSSLRGAADVMIEMENNEGTIKIGCSKIKDGKEFDPRRMRMIEIPLEPGITSCVLVPTEMVKPDENELTQNQQAVVEWLAGDVFDHGARSSDLQKATNLSGSSFYRVIDSLTRRGIIRKEGKYDPWLLTQKGAMLANRYGYTRR